MCIVSAIYDYGRQSQSSIDWSMETYRKYLELLEAAKKFDEAAKQPDCEDPEKAKWLQEIKPTGE